MQTTELAANALTAADGAIGLLKFGPKLLAKITSWFSKESAEVANVGLKVTEKGLARVEAHLAQFGASPENKIMIDRLRSGMATEVDKNFYLHELKESALMKSGMDYAAAHRATLEWQKIPYVRGFEANLYHPDAMKAAGLETWSAEALRAAGLLK